MANPAMENADTDWPLELLEKLSAEVDGALAKLDGRCQGFLAGYQFHSATHYSAAARGYILLRRAGEVSAAQQLLRPMMETWVRIAAIREEPVTLYRIAMGEMVSDETWLKVLNPAGFIDDGAAQIMADQRDKFHEMYVKEFPIQDLTGVPRKDIPIEGLLSAANLGPLYNPYYRLLCRHTHGNLSSMAGFYSDINIKEGSLVAAGLQEMMNTLKGLGATCPNSTTLSAEISNRCAPDESSRPS